MRNAIQGLWDKAKFGPLPGWTQRAGSNPSSGTAIYADDANDVRRWLNFYESRRYGAYSVAYYPGTPGDPQSPDDQITASWAEDVKHLGAPFVRVLINSRPSDNDITSTLSTYKTLCALYRDRGIHPIGVLTAETDRPAFVGDPNAPLNQSNSNTYIDHFSVRTRTVARELKNVVDHFEIWNEPNNWDRVTLCPNLCSDNFACMIYYTARRIKIEQPDPPNPNAQIWLAVYSTTTVSQVTGRRRDGTSPTSRADPAVKEEDVLKWGCTSPLAPLIGAILIRATTRTLGTILAFTPIPPSASQVPLWMLQGTCKSRSPTL